MENKDKKKDNIKKEFVIPMSNLNYEGKQLRKIVHEGGVWFVAIDVGEILELTDIRKSLTNLHKEDRNTIPVLSKQGTYQKTFVVNESGLYDLVLQSRKPNAKQFRRWITKEVIPSIRKTGSYAIYPFSHEAARVYERKEFKSLYKELSSIAKQDGGVTDFAVFHSAGYEGFYAGQGIRAIERKRGIPEKQGLDHMGSYELSAHNLRLQVTTRKIEKDKPHDQAISNNIHYMVGREIRQLLIRIDEIKPEDLPVYEDIKKINSNKASNQDISKINIDISKDLWKVALLIIAKNGGEATTAKLREDIPALIKVDEKYLESNNSYPEQNKIDQIIRNLKSNGKRNSIGFIKQGYAEDIPQGFKITQKGKAFVREYFKDFL